MNSQENPAEMFADLFEKYKYTEYKTITLRLFLSKCVCGYDDVTGRETRRVYGNGVKQDYGRKITKNY